MSSPIRLDADRLGPPTLPRLREYRPADADVD